MVDEIRYLPLDEIKVDRRFRRDCGDVTMLAQSIEKLGLLQPVIIRPDNTLVAGMRRCKAMEQLGWARIPCYVANGLEDELRMILAERDENTCRLEFAPTEAVAIGREIESREKELARQRQATHLEGNVYSACGKFPEAGFGTARDRVGAAVGMSGKTYEKAAKILEAAERNPEKFGDLPSLMDEKRKVEPAYKQFVDREKQQSRIDKAKKAQNIECDSIINCRFQDAEIEDSSIDIIITDPPYGIEFEKEWFDLGIFAKKVLKPSGLLISYFGQLNMPIFIKDLSENLKYYWCMSLIHTGNKQLVMPRNIFCGWKPILIFQKDPFKRIDEKFEDIIEGSGREKDDHEWQQGLVESMLLVEKFTMENEIIVDPFAGSGTTVLAALKLKRKAIGIEIDYLSYNIVKERIVNGK